MAYIFIIMPNDHFFEVAATILATNRPLSAIYFTYADMILYIQNEYKVRIQYISEWKSFTFTHCFVSFSPLLAVYPGFLLFCDSLLGAFSFLSDSGSSPFYLSSPSSWSASSTWIPLWSYSAILSFWPPPFSLFC